MACNAAAVGAQEANGAMTGDIVIEPVGGATGGNIPSGPTQTEGRVVWSALSKADQARIDALFAAHQVLNDNMHYRLTRDGPNGRETVDAPMDAVPKALTDSIKTTFK